MSTASDSWCTPPEVADPLAEFFGGPVEVDPCSNSRSIVLAKRSYRELGLVLPWGRTTYENNPYSETGAWTEKAIAEMRCGNVRELVRLTMASTSSIWWKRQCLVPRRNPRLLFTKRLKFLKFIDPLAAHDGSKQDPLAGSRFEPVLTYFGPRAQQFDRCFRSLTVWASWGR